MCRKACLKKILGGAFVAVMAAGLAVTITAQAPTNNTIYACVNPSGLVRIIPPRAACLGSEQPIQWNITGPAGPQGPPGPSDDAVVVGVDCTKGERVTPVLLAHRDHRGRLNIGIWGVCEESVYIERDDVGLWGARPGDGLSVPGSSGNPLIVQAGIGSTCTSSPCRAEDTGSW